MAQNRFKSYPNLHRCEHTTDAHSIYCILLEFILYEIMNGNVGFL